MTVPTSVAPTYAPPARSTAELSMIAGLSEDAQKLLGSDEPVSPRSFLGQLMDKELHIDAVKFLAHALPRREAVWWAWVCARKASGPEPATPIKHALDAAERWIVQPTDEHRRQAFAFGEAADFGTAAGCACLAAFMSGGSLGPADTPPVPPGEFMTAKAVFGSVTLAAVATEPDAAPQKFGEFMKLGVEVAERTRLWPTS